MSERFPIPPHARESLENYYIYGWRPGGFCEAMLAMDMPRALTIADVANAHSIYSIGRWIMEQAPADSWGSYEAIDAWCDDVDQRRTKYTVWLYLNKDNTPVDYSF